MLVQGTNILTALGYRPIEQLRQGDQVRSAFDKTTHFEIVAVMNRGVPIYDGTSLYRPHSLLSPVTIPKGAFGPARPRRDLVSSPKQQVIGHFALSDQQKVLRNVAADECSESQRPRSGKFQWVEYFALFFDQDSYFIAEGLGVAGYSMTQLSSMPQAEECDQPF